MIVLLVRHGADWTLQNKDGYTPLHIAAQFQLTSVCAYYLALGAVSTTQDSQMYHVERGNES